MKVVGFVLKKILTYFEMLIVPHALHCVDSYPLAQQRCGGDIGSVPYVCTYERSFGRSYVHLLSSL